MGAAAASRVYLLLQVWDRDPHNVKRTRNNQDRGESAVAEVVKAAGQRATNPKIAGSSPVEATSLFP